MAEAKLDSELLAGGPVLLAGRPRPRQGPLEAARAIATDDPRTGALPVTWSHLRNNVLCFQGLDTPAPTPRVPDPKDELLKIPSHFAGLPKYLGGPSILYAQQFQVYVSAPGEEVRVPFLQNQFILHSVRLSVVPPGRKSYNTLQ